MNTKALEKFAQAARRQLHEQVAAKLQRVLHTDSAELRGQAAALHKLQSAIAETSRAAVIERVAYIWFNRFCALRYMDVNHYTAIGVVSPQEGFTQPALLQEAKQGHIDDDLAPFVDRQRVFDLLARRQPSQNPEQEAYRLLLIGVCNYYHDTMSFLFERIDDYTQLLIPDDLLSENSIIQAMRDAMTLEACQDVEVIGWLYQFYISEKKDDVFAALKKGQKIKAADIPAASQLFTPHWIVRYMVENSLGRLWLLNRPTSRLAEHMEYYIAPETPETDFLRVASPEEIKLCDPAAGSGHILTYAFDLLYAIYAEEGYNPPDIPKLILEKNLVGLEIDERAGVLAAFALVMKAREKDRRFLRRGITPRICVLKKIAFEANDLKREAWIQESGNPKEALLHDLHLFAEADNFGSLLRPQLSAQQITALRWHMEAKQGKGQADWIEQERRNKITRALAQAEVLADNYHVVVANPPYMGGKGMNDGLKRFLDTSYRDSKTDLFSAFITRIMETTTPGGFSGIMTPFTWMFLSSFEKLRQKILDEAAITSLVRPEYHAFFESAYVPVCSFTLFNRQQFDFRGAFIDLNAFYGVDVQPVKLLEAINNPNCGYFYRAAATDIKKISGSPIAYWVSNRVREVFVRGIPIGTIAAPRKGNTTTDNNRFLRLWFETASSRNAIGFNDSALVDQHRKKWVPYNKGGGYRKWYGLNLHLVNWEHNGQEIKSIPHSVIANEQYFFQPGLTWSTVTSSNFSIRQFSDGFIFDNGGCCVFGEPSTLVALLALMNSKVFVKLFSEINPTLNFQSGDVARVPYWPLHDEAQQMVSLHTAAVISAAAADWDMQEISWDFIKPYLLREGIQSRKLETSYVTLCEHWRASTKKMQLLEETNNRIFIEAYGLQEELTPEVLPEEITLTCNPHYRYGGNKSEAELEELLRADTMREFISYAVGCMFGRYSLDKPGLILANQGETLADYLRQVPLPTFEPDKDNVIPILDGEWFPDDMVARFNRFLRVTFGEEHFQENLAFIEQAIGRELRGYFLRDFYDHHVRMYQKRPIYWLFSSPKGSFNALIYMHRYRPDTVSVVLNNYLRDYRSKLIAHRAHQEQLSISASAAPRDKTRALKEIDRIDKVLRELTDYENDILYPLATQQVQIDLDDGVKVNYNKFGSALKKVTGLSE